MNPHTQTKTLSGNWNSEFDFWKFVASIFILLIHSFVVFGEKLLCHRGWISVELFLIITGYLFAQSINKVSRPFSSETIGGETWAFLVKKFKGSSRSTFWDSSASICAKDIYCSLPKRTPTLSSTFCFFASRAGRPERYKESTGTSHACWPCNSSCIPCCGGSSNCFPNGLPRLSESF